MTQLGAMAFVVLVLDALAEDPPCKISIRSTSGSSFEQKLHNVRDTLSLSFQSAAWWCLCATHFPI